MWCFSYLKNGLKKLCGISLVGFLISAFPGLSFCTENSPPANNADSPFSTIFSEKILTVSHESDGILPGTLRSALIQAAGIRSQNPFTVVKVVFDPSVKIIRVTKGPLPDISGSLTTLDCQTGSGRVVILGSSNPNNSELEGEFDGLKITSSSNTIRNCHITGFTGAGIWVGGNRNILEYNTLGYHPNVAESAIEGNTLGEIKSNKASGIYLTDGAAENSLTYNELVGNGADGIELSPQSGGGNKISFNFFAKNQGKPIKSSIGINNTPPPQITSIIPQGDMVLITGTAPRNSEFQLYLQGKEEGEIGQTLVPGTIMPKDQFTILTKNLGFVAHQTKLIAITRIPGKNTSEFSQPTLLLGPAAAPVENPSNSTSTIFTKDKPLPATNNPPTKFSPPPIDDEPEEEYNEEDIPYNLQGKGTPSHDPAVGGLAQS